ncbi:hypothetical protein STS98_003043 [Cronobacter sakazakii]|uniref:hypothetical protein n=1 Tax=Cronobacter malonaticus TaxID=413503 RepID=UPI00067B9147|nr:hypothetical protein [Cronobacter malonaticus]ELQ6063237.1 hypothetical protein [Cronobacter sakazakii]ELZ1647629.1 hypothetical protein [Cronobacter sakazakii]HDC4406051.1 hypothetical protein [Enterobacter cloacae]
MAWRRSNSPNDMRRFINNNSPAIGREFKKELSNRMRIVTQHIQRKIDNDVAGGGVAFTGKSMYFNFKKVSDYKTVNQIIVLPNQTSYLKYILDPAYKHVNEDKIIPYKNAKLTKQGNITQLRSRTKSDKYKKVKSRNGNTYLIDTTKKSSNRNPKLTREKRVIGYYGSVGRKPLFDFYDVTETQVIEQLRTLRGTFDYRWRK